MKAHFLGSERVHCRWNHDLPPILEVDSGDEVTIECPDSSGGQLHAGSLASDLVTLDRDRIHTIVGPIAVRGAEPGDVLEIHVLDVQHHGWGWTSIIPGLGLLKEDFLEPDLLIWKLEESWTSSLAPAVVPLRPFCGIMGVAPAERGEFRTRPPGVFGGNLDVRDLGKGATLYLPVQVPGALFSTGDAHGAQGDGEVCLNGIEMPCTITVRLTIRRDLTLAGPRAETSGSDGRSSPGPAWLFLSSKTDAHAAAQDVVRQAITFLGEKWGLSRNRAYMLCSVALDLRISQWVNDPMVTITGALPKMLLPRG